VSVLISSRKSRAAAAGLKCRICGASSVEIAGEVEYYAGFSLAVFDCAACGCRFTDHDNSVYELLHASGAVSYYNDYRELAAQCKAFFDRRDLAGLKSLLRQVSKYRFIIDEVERMPRDARLLEVGCSRGYLTSSFILEGRNVLGADISAAALQGARESFGNHFVEADSPAVQSGAPYDVIYHVGMIGCVADPLGLTRGLLAMLKPGGMLLFNAPNVRSCYLRNQLWLDSAPPPDVVTLFAPKFWSRQMTEFTEISENEEMLPADLGLKVGLRKLFGRRWNRPEPAAPLTSQNAAAAGSRISGGAWDVFERAVAKGGRLTGLSRWAVPQPAEFGLHIRMTKKTDSARSTDSVLVADTCGI
jgi:2-polyprenyl-3-methyl-5-hydroxy-6-metoxy-1,4-benzoquinol methylase